MISNRKSALIGLGLVAAALGAALVWLFRDSLRAYDYQATVDWIASFGPLPFFIAMAILPSLWAPASPFMILAGALYSVPLALGGSILALGANMTLSWLLAGKLFRPLFERIVLRFGYRVPEITRGNMITVAVLLRITPGVPFPLQNYLLGLARMPFGWFLGISLPISSAYAFAFILFGDAILKGNVTVVLLAISLLIGLSFGVRLLRARLKRGALEGESL